jgi:hypothetical protein
VCSQTFKASWYTRRLARTRTSGMSTYTMHCITSFVTTFDYWEGSALATAPAFAKTLSGMLSQCVAVAAQPRTTGSRVCWPLMMSAAQHSRHFLTMNKLPSIKETKNENDLIRRQVMSTCQAGVSSVELSHHALYPIPWHARHSTYPCTHLSVGSPNDEHFPR